VCSSSEPCRDRLHDVVGGGDANPFVKLGDRRGTCGPCCADAGPLDRDHVLRDSGAALLLTTGAVFGAATGLEKVPVDVAATSASGVTRGGPGPDGAALILYTSGTTGPPKGVVLSRRAVTADLDALAEAWAWGPDDVLVHGLPLFHVHGLVLGVLGALHTGGRLIHTGRPTPGAYAAAVETGGTLVFGVPTVWARVAADPSAGALRSARLLVSGSAALPAGVLAPLQARCGQVPVERYGMTETLITVSMRAGESPRPGSVGRALAGVETRLVGEDGAPVASDGETVGSLQVRGATLMDGYLGQPDVTAASYRTPERNPQLGNGVGRFPDWLGRSRMTPKPPSTTPRLWSDEAAVVDLALDPA
jgi:fatty acid CoA ligase FadD36